MIQYASSGIVSKILDQMTREVSELDPLAAGTPELPSRQQNDQLMKSSSKVVSPGAYAGQSCHHKEGRGSLRSGGGAWNLPRVQSEEIFGNTENINMCPRYNYILIRDKR